MKLIKIITLMLAVTFVTACAGNQSLFWGAWKLDNPQNNAGGEEWTMNYVCPENPSSPCMESLSYLNYKNSAASQIAIQLNDGTILNFAGEDINGSDAIQIRGVVEQELARAGVTITDGLLAISNLTSHIH